MKVRTIKAGKSFTLYPLSDVHWPNHDTKKLDAWREAVLDDPEALVTLGGDLFDFARGHYRKHLESYTADSNSRSLVDAQAYAWVEGLSAYLKPIRARIVSTVVGNHFWRFANGRVSDQEVALELKRGDTFAGALGITRVNLAGRAHVQIALHHCAGRKGGTASTDLLAFQHWSHACDADIYIAGHTHRQYAGIYQTRITADESSDQIGAKHLVWIRSGAFLKGYADSVSDPEKPFVPDYAEVMMLPPSVFGLVSVRVEAGPTGKLFYTLRQRTL